MRNDKKVCRLNKAIHLSGFIKTKHVVLGLIWRAIPFLRKKRGEKGGKARVCKEEWLGLGFASHFLLLGDQTTYKRRFEGAKVRKIKTLTSFF